MKYFRIELELTSPILTAIHSGTLFGQLCWAWRTLYGESRLVQWLENWDAEPLLLSSAMPSGYLPRPMLRPLRRGGSRLALKEIDVAKTLRKSGWIPRDVFLRIRRSLTESGVMLALLTNTSEASPNRLTEIRTAHNTIDRLTGTTPDAGGLYFVDESWPQVRDRKNCFDVYVGGSIDLQQLERLFTHIGEWGFGRDASTGRGRWRAHLLPEETGLFDGSGTRRMSLSHGTLTGNMEDPRYKLHVHYGKVGGGYGTTSNPFKYPITLLQPGATFRSNTGAGPWGELLRQVHPEKSWIVHNAQHLTVAFTEGVDG